MADLRSIFQGYDLDSGGGTDYVLGVNLRLSASGGSIEALGQQAMASSIPVVIASNQSALTTGGGAAHDAAATGNPLLLGGYASAAAPTDVSADADVVRAWFLRNGAQAAVLTAAGALIGGDATNGLDVDVTRVTGTVTVDSELPAAASLTDNFSNPSAPAVGAFHMVWDGSTWDRAPGTSTDGLLVNLGANNDVTFSPTAPTSPLSDYVTSASLAAGSEANLDSAEAAGKKLAQVTAWSSVAFRARVFLVNNGVEATEALAIGGGAPFTGWTWTAPHPDYAALGTTAGADTFRVEMINLDDANAADVHCVFLYQS